MQASASFGKAEGASVRARPAYTTVLYLLVDMVMLTAAVWLGIHAWLLVNPAVDPRLYYGFWPMLFVFPLAFARSGLYPGHGLNPAAEMRQLFYLISSVYLIAIAVMFLGGLQQGYSRGIYLASWLLSIALVPLGRALIREAFAWRSWWGTPVVILGAGDTAAMVCERLVGQPGIGFKPVACFDDEASKIDGRLNVPRLGDTKDAAAWAKEHGVSHAIVAMPKVGRDDLIEIVNRHTDAFVKLIFVSEFFSSVGLWVSRQELGNVLGLQIQRNLLMPANRRLKRSLDLVLAIPLLVVAFPILLISAIAIFIVSPGLPFYAQRREGQDGREVRVWKLRTMRKDAEERLERALAEDPQLRTEWERFYKLKSDPRVLPVIGNLLRRASLDELPQLWNVVKGEMSLVGPRPFPYYHLEQFDPEFRALRRKVPPGITGLWQVSERSEGDLDVQEDLDSYYIHDWSLWLDLYLLFRTPWSVLFGKGAY